ncbi:MAG: Lrp/AsnC family transcriptional regulator [Candidatus Poseidoniales archaeon]|jgi:DNA-binding Lrp family transcriptional regulator|tara:strand:- start:56 stop:289 length:234 start_codon:yes stop_codon:yes gene_type:complete
MPEAFILFKTQPSHEREVYFALDNHSNVAELHVLYGEYDLVARVTAKDSKELTSYLMQDFRQIDGVRDTQTLIAVDY